MLNHDFNNHKGVNSITKGKLPLKFTMPYIKFNGTENPYHHMKNFLSTLSLKGINKDIFHVTFLWTFDKDVTSWYNLVDRRKLG